MAAYRRVTVPQFLVAVSQLGLTLFAIGLCAVETKVNGPLSGLCSLTCHLHYELFHGYPVPWLEYEQTGTMSPLGTSRVMNEPEFRGINLAIPAAMLTLALCLPPVAARLVRTAFGPSREPLSRTIRCLGVAVAAAVAGLGVAALDTLSDWSGVSEVPFAQFPGQWGNNNPHRDSVQSWLRRNRQTFVYPLAVALGPDGSLEHNRHKQYWAGRTRRTIVGITIGAIFGCLFLRPWRRSVGPAAVSGAAVTTPPVE